ncbi:hypothetical protein Tco_0349662 [Tanacetum coccineum]
MQLEERQLHSKCLAWFKELKSHLENLYKFWEVRNTRPFEITFRIFFHEEHKTFREKMYHNLNQLQWQLKKENLHSCDPKTCLDDFKDYTRCELETYRRNLLRYLEELDKLIDARVVKYRELRMKESEVQAIKEIEKWLKEREIHQQESLFTEGAALEVCLVTKGASLEASLVTKGSTLKASAALEASLITKGRALDENLVTQQCIVNSTTSLEQHNESNSSRNERSRSDNDAYADIGPSYDSDTISEVLTNKSVEAKIKFDTEDLETINIELEYSSLYDSDPSNVESESEEKKIIFGNETSSFETKIKELEMTLAQQTKDFEDAKVNFSKKMDKFETYFEKLKNTKVVIERQLDRKIQDSKAEKDHLF